MGKAIMLNSTGGGTETFTIPETVTVTGWKGIMAQWEQYISDASNDIYMILCHDFSWDGTPRVVGAFGTPGRNDATTNYNGQLVVVGSWASPSTCDSYSNYVFREGDVFTIYRNS